MAMMPGNTRILIVEDDATVRRLMTTHFRRSGFEVEYAMAAEEVAADERYDLVLTDVHLPGESGVDMARRIHEQQPDQPVVFVTGDPDAQLAHDAIRSGAAGYLLKPFELFELDALVNQALRARTPQQRARVIAPRQDFGTPVTAHRHVTRVARVVLSPRARRRPRAKMRFRVAAAVIVLLATAFGAGAAIAPAQVERGSHGDVASDGKAPIVVPVVMDRTVYIDR
jgi:DNA-binding response OmpR family regulator